jgi:hypothetical protein
VEALHNAVASPMAMSFADVPSLYPHRSTALDENDMTATYGSRVHQRSLGSASTKSRSSMRHLTPALLVVCLRVQPSVRPGSRTEVADEGSRERRLRPVADE